MTQDRTSTIVAVAAAAKEAEERRSNFVRIPRGADSSLFGGWGVRI